MIKIILYILLCICCLLFGHIRGYKQRKEEEQEPRVEIIFNEEYDLTGVYCNGKITKNVSVMVEEYEDYNDDEKNDNQ